MVRLSINDRAVVRVILAFVLISVSTEQASRAGAVIPQSGRATPGERSDQSRITSLVPDPPADGAGWESYLAYYRHLSQLSNRLTVDELGRTALGRPLVALTLSAPENLRQIYYLRGQQRRLVDPPHRESSAGSMVQLEENRNVILITNTSNPSHSDVGTRVIARLVRSLLSDQTTQIDKILRETVILIVPSTNPDSALPPGLRLPGEAFDRSPSRTASVEGSKLRRSPSEDHFSSVTAGDWDAFTQVETRLIAEKLLNSWQPRVWYEVSPEKLIRDSRTAARNVIEVYPASARLLVPPRAVIASFDSQIQRKEGSGASFWSRHHAGIHLVSRFAAAPNASRSVENIVDDQVAVVTDFLSQATKERQQIFNILATLAKAARRPQPFAYLLPEPAVPLSISNAYQELSRKLKDISGSEKQQHDQAEALYSSLAGSLPAEDEVLYYYRTEGLDRLIGILRRGGVEVRRASKSFVANGRQWPAGTHLVQLSGQSAADFARTTLEPASAGFGNASGILPLLLNVAVIRVNKHFDVESAPEPTAVVLQERVRENGGVRVGIYQGRLSSADADWTRWVLDQYRFGYQVVSDQELDAPGLRDRFDAIIIPDQPALATGISAINERDSEISSLQSFVKSGGTLVTINRASNFAISRFDLPVRDIRELQPKPIPVTSGAILRLEVNKSDPLCLGVSQQSVAWFEGGPVFDIIDPGRVRVLASFSRNSRLVLNGPVEGTASLRGRAALVEVPYGEGRVILFAFQPFYRGRSLVTYPFLFNLLLSSGRG